MGAHYFVQGLFALSGLLAVLAAVGDWEWFFTTRNMQFLVTRIGRGWTRVVYGILGLVLIGMAACFFYLTPRG